MELVELSEVVDVELRVVELVEYVLPDVELVELSVVELVE